MKKLTAAFLCVMLIVALLCMSGCGLMLGILDGLYGDDFGYGDDGYDDYDDKWDGGYGNNNGNSDDSDHTHVFDSYFVYSVCSVDGCGVVGRKDSINKYANDFTYTLTQAKISAIDDVYDEMLANIDDGDDYNQFEELFGEYLDWFDYVSHQYQVASVLADVEYTATTASNYSTVSSLYNEMFANYYGVYALVYNSDYRANFYDGWTEDDIQQALYFAEVYGGSADNNNALDEILSEYENYMNDIGWEFSERASTKANQLKRVGEIYGKLVEANNNVATAHGYDNYMDYAYANEYNRSYTPSDVAEVMRGYVKEYIAPLFIDVYARYYTLYTSSSNSMNSVNKNFYNGLTGDSLFAATSDSSFSRVRSTIEYVADYFEYLQMSAAVAGGAKVDFSSAVENLFKNGNYFTGEYEGAYTWWIDKISAPILYFGSGYDTAFTFVHEFGHYYENIYNGSLSLSYDHDETHSQGNEMLFLAWLAQNKPSGVTTGFDLVEIEQLFDMLANIVMSTAVDEFEQAAYTGDYSGSQYAELFADVLSSYKGTYNGQVISAADLLTTEYWTYVVFSSSAYYISYAMSALPSIELYAIAQSRGLDTAKECYIKLFTFANSSRFVSTDSYGHKYLKDGATYDAILEYSSLQGPFQEGLYTTLQSYFNSRSDL